MRWISNAQYSAMVAFIVTVFIQYGGTDSEAVRGREISLPGDHRLGGVLDLVRGSVNDLLPRDVPSPKVHDLIFDDNVSRNRVTTGSRNSKYSCIFAGSCHVNLVPPIPLRQQKDIVLDLSSKHRE